MKQIRIIACLSILCMLLASINDALAKRNRILHKWYRVSSMPVDLATSYVPFLEDSLCTIPNVFICTIVDEADLSGMYPAMTWGLVSTHNVDYEITKRRKP